MFLVCGRPIVTVPHTLEAFLQLVNQAPIEGLRGTDTEDMNKICIIVVLLSAIHISVEAASKSAQGCELKRNNDWTEMEPKGNPLLIQVKLEILHIRDVPDRGGSFGTDLK